MVTREKDGLQDSTLIEEFSSEYFFIRSYQAHTIR